jgi:hypothetical protein
MTPMTFLPPSASTSLSRICAPRALWADLVVIAVLIGLDAAARLFPHPPNFTPVAASALFAVSVLRFRGSALLVPIAAMLLGDAVHGFYDWRVMTAVYAALTLPACAGFVSSRLRGAAMIVPVMLPCSLAFFLLTNFAVWAFGAMYSADLGGLVTCYVAALPFLKYTVAGDLFWAAALFGGYWLLRQLPPAYAGLTQATVVAPQPRT